MTHQRPPRRHPTTRRTFLSLLLATGSQIAMPPPVVAAHPSHTVIELRQYRIVAGRREAFTDLLEREFIDSQDAVGMRLIGQFHDADDDKRFTWIRGIPDMRPSRTWGCQAGEGLSREDVGARGSIHGRRPYLQHQMGPAG